MNSFNLDMFEWYIGKQGWQSFIPINTDKGYHVDQRKWLFKTKKQLETRQAVQSLKKNMMQDCIHLTCFEFISLD